MAVTKGSGEQEPHRGSKELNPKTLTEDPSVIFTAPDRNRLSLQHKSGL